MCPTKSEAQFLPKRSPFLGGREFRARWPVRQVRFLFGSSFKREFSSASFYTFDKSLADLGEVGLSQLLYVDWLLA